MLNSPSEPTDHYFSNFNWNKVRYRTDRPLGELIENLTKVFCNPTSALRSLCHSATC